MSQRILVILGHSSPDSWCGALADAYAAGAREAGHEVRLLRLSELKFDPILRDGHQGTQGLEPDLVEAQQSILWAQHLVVIYPTWWGTMPALLKGFVDRTFTPGFAFRHHDDSRRWERLLSGRSAHLLVTMDTPPWYYRLIYMGVGHRAMKTAILKFCGIRPVKVTSIGPVKGSTREFRHRWIVRAHRFGRQL
jgi:putative NADPH-quinone reductase